MESPGLGANIRSEHLNFDCGCCFLRMELFVYLFIYMYLQDVFFHMYFFIQLFSERKREKERGLI